MNGTFSEGKKSRKLLYLLIFEEMKYVCVCLAEYYDTFQKVPTNTQHQQR